MSTDDKEQIQMSSVLGEIKMRVLSYVSSNSVPLKTCDVRLTQRSLEIFGNVSLNKLDEFILLRVQEYENQIAIPNIFIPTEWRRKGVGKHIISLVFAVCKLHEYELFITDLTLSFYSRLLERGALECDQEDTLQIVDSTNLKPSMA